MSSSDRAAAVAPRGPLVIGGLGGSGTRVYQRIARVAGYQMLMWSWLWPPPRRVRARSHDCAPMDRHFYPRWIDPHLQGRLSRAGRMRMRWSCRFWLWTCHPWPSQPWGWKNPSAQLLVDFLDELYPGLRFIRVMRDGRDHAFNPTFPYRRYEQSLLDEDERGLPDHVRKAVFWSRYHAATDRQQVQLGDRILSSRLEDMCAAPRDEVTRVLGFLGADDPKTIARAVDLVETPGSLGRWRQEPAEQVRQVEDAIAETLVQYGYELGPTQAPSSPASARSASPTNGFRATTHP